MAAANSDNRVVPQEFPLDEAAFAAPRTSQYSSSFFRACDVCLRVLLFALSLVAVVVAVTSNQTETVPVLLPNAQTPILVSAAAKFRYIPAMIFMVVALSVSGLYSIITIILSLSALLKLKSDLATRLLPHLVIFDILLFGIQTAASGAAASTAYTGLEGNSHVRWGKVCGIYDKFCWRAGSSIALSLFASIVLLLLVLLSVINMSKKIQCK